MCLCFKEGASYRLRTAVRTGQPPPFVQHLHQTHDRHLTLSPADHVQETLRGQNQADSLLRTKVQHPQPQLGVLSFCCISLSAADVILTK